jgi:hypothetical protein
MTSTRRDFVGGLTLAGTADPFGIRLLRAEGFTPRSEEGPA